MITSKKSAIILLLNLCVLLVSSGCADISINPDVNSEVPGNISGYKYNAVESFAYRVELTTQSALTVEGINGKINVLSVSGTDYVTISGEKVVASDTYRDADSHLGDISIVINKISDKLLVKTDQPQFSDGRSYNVNYTISIPDHMNVNIKNINGKISGNLTLPLNGSVRMSLVNGSIELGIPNTTSADFSAGLGNGSISMGNLILLNRIATSKSLCGTLGTGEGMIDLRTVNGNIIVTGY